MNSHTLKLTLRNFRRHKSSFFINLIGLSTGLACTLLIVLWVNDELSMDKFHAQEDRLYNVMEHQQYAESVMTTNSTPGMLAETLKEEVPEIEYAATITWNNTYTLSVGETNIQAKGYHAGSDFFKMFSFELLQGQPESVLRDLNAIVLSRSTAENLFGSATDAVGQSLEINHEEVYQVSGIFEDTPNNSSYDFDLILNFEKFKNEEGNSWLRSWDSNGPSTKVILTEGADAAAVEAKIADFVKQRNEDSNVTLFLKPFSESYLYGRYESGKLVGGRIDYVRLFSIIAAFILIIACINFMNLSTARASLRAKEVGVKKAVGAGKASLIWQYLTESTLIAFAAFVVAILLVFLVLPQFNLITDKEISLRFSPEMGLGFLGIMFITGLLAGSYPALYLSSFKPVAVLKGEIKTSLGELWARRGLVIFQFTLSVILIVAVSVVYQQIKYVQSKNLGYDKDNLIYFSMNGRVEEQAEAFLAEAGNLPGVASISSIGHDLIGRQNNTSGLDWPGKDPETRILFENVRVNYDLLETIDVEMQDGRTFSREFGADTSKIIFNEAAIKVMNLEDPIGQKIRLWGRYDREIIGVVKDFHFQSLHEEVKPLFFVLDEENTWMVMARLEAGRTQEAIGNLQEFYEAYNPGFAFNFEFSDEQYALQYAAEQRVASLSKYFAGFAILISCLGLFGLAAFTADRKKKEIGIRKVLGASVANIVTLLTRDFTRLVLVAILIGLPVAYYITGQWLNRFAFRIDLTIWYFLLAGSLVLFISWLTVGSQAFRSAHVDPKECLRDI
ncbi:ABC transporter permease [Flavilitoribacter nigricans]|uniref:Transporter permease n=1 Tax=Flavilitoribacter nigricans (strain ATCC 23147 / DSM 23189 / NBRC 102662 / NCIMB 1420 / SS-2) TaxID=1122177 RepID=A0A2D0NCJ5_FLAN2|nr:ABC transporter permease [Flavilitoribacter nigricans]PHN06234.1 transporter permease [Flavilitoribacter nigricans DSM 23189 = NBRC 102662]